MNLAELEVILGEPLHVAQIGSQHVVHFPSVELSNGLILSACNGRGSSIRLAKRDYTNQLAGAEIRCRIKGQVVYLTLPETLTV